MNINLLPQKFVKNRATDLIIMGTIVASLFFIILIVVIQLFFSIQLSQLSGKVQQAKVEKFTLQNEASLLKESQSLDIQNYLTTFKTDKKLMSPVMGNFEKVAGGLNLKILNYQVFLIDPEDQSNQNQNFVGATGEPLLQPITIRLQGDLFDHTAKFKTEIEKIDWVYDVQPVRMTTENDKTESEFVIRIKKEQVTGAVEKEGAES
ncbi:hypothetical protein [Isobaculum melis]|uniref:Tfp pilus assembly protein PilN n=1 Tax=Isobaculum melis TaxID=142588 RepID=A0A1H9S4P3_9LACT|nr:hypothetical protein [Isobaculum melis]SER79595.1 hypothetical protein SAMN04488559_10680 [Isobaculum melis]